MKVNVEQVTNKSPNYEKGAIYETQLTGKISKSLGVVYLFDCCGLASQRMWPGQAQGIPRRYLVWPGFLSRRDRWFQHR